MKDITCRYLEANACKSIGKKIDQWNTQTQRVESLEHEASIQKVSTRKESNQLRQ